MIKNQYLLASEIDAFFNKTNTKWTFGNSILYDMCAQRPLHNDADVIAGKMWIIGRSYAASIERHKKNSGANSASDFYFDVVAPKMISIGQELDERIEQLNCYTKVTENILDEVLDTHKFLMDALAEIVNQGDRSFTAKYLHFHCPSVFYILDSRANKSVREKVKIDQRKLYRHTPCNFDADYTNFCVRMLELQEWIEMRYKKTLSPRELDNFLIDW